MQEKKNHSGSFVISNVYFFYSDTIFFHKTIVSGLQFPWFIHMLNKSLNSAMFLLDV